MEKINELRELLILSSESTEKEIKQRFDNIAEILVSDVAIQKGSSIYCFAEFEFYFYNKNHQDIITHPRICNAMKWYVNDFGGIDLSFESHVDTKEVRNSQNKKVAKPILNENAYFGGILIRELKEINTNQDLKGPLACAELFRVHDAVRNDNDYPILVETSTGFAPNNNPNERLNLRKRSQKEADKVKSLLSNYANGNDEELIKNMTSIFEKYEKQLYRYHTNA